jgi:asparaginyl-tRNA synthetase
LIIKINYILNVSSQVGELIGGSEREERLDELEKAVTEKGLNINDYRYYTDLRKYGTVRHGGFGLGFERLVMIATGIENIRDSIPFPRTPGQADF